MTIIDAHVHIGYFQSIDLGNDIEDVLSRADKMGVEKVFCTHCQGLYGNYTDGNEVVYQAMQKYPDRVLGYVTVNSPRYGKPLYDYVQHAIFDRGFSGIKIYSHSQGVGSAIPFLSVADPYMYPLFEMAQEWQTPILAHATSAEVDVICKDFPKLVLMMAHMGATPVSGGDWHTAISTAKKHPNLILDSTGSAMDSGMIEEAVRVIGPERVLWGSDMPMIDPWINIERIHSAEISDADKEWILGKNILRLVANGRRTADKLKAAQA